MTEDKIDLKFAKKKARPGISRAVFEAGLIKQYVPYLFVGLMGCFPAAWLLGEGMVEVTQKLIWKEAKRPQLD